MKKQLTIITLLITIFTISLFATASAGALVAYNSQSVNSYCVLMNPIHQAWGSTFNCTRTTSITELTVNIRVAMGHPVVELTAYITNITGTYGSNASPDRSNILATSTNHIDYDSSSGHTQVTRSCLTMR